MKDVGRQPAVFGSDSARTEPRPSSLRDTVRFPAPKVVVLTVSLRASSTTCASSAAVGRCSLFSSWYRG